MVYTAWNNKIRKKTLEFRESDVSPGQTEVNQGKFVEFIFRAKGYFRETYKWQNINRQKRKKCTLAETLLIWV